MIRKYSGNDVAFDARLVIEELLKKSFLVIKKAFE